MKARYVVDTNVLIAASAANPSNPKDIDATPTEPELRMQVWKWLCAFEESPAKMVLDWQQQIEKEYCKKLGFNDYGRQVLLKKMNTGAVDWVNLAYDADGHGVLPQKLNPVVHDLADRKMVAAALEANRLHGEAPIAFAGDTDWHEWEGALQKHGVALEPIIEAWSRAKFEAKKLR